MTQALIEYYYHPGIKCKTPLAGNRAKVTISDSDDTKTPIIMIDTYSMDRFLHSIEA